MKYQTFMQQSGFEKHEILSFAQGNLLEDAPAEFKIQLPAPPMLMIDRILEIHSEGARGRIVAERDVAVDDWFFQCHFRNDPVQPGCLGVDGVWQLLGFFCAWNGGLGSGRALGCGEVEFSGQIRPFDKQITYDLEVHRYSPLDGGAGVAIGSGRVLVDGKHIYSVRHLKAGVFPDIRYDDYPNPDSPFARGGERSYS